MYLLVSGGDFVFTQTHLTGKRGELAVDIAPLAQTPVRQKVLLTLINQLALGFFVPDRVIKKFP